jgi:hypothetical protein
MAEKCNGNIQEYYDEEKIILLRDYYIFNNKIEGIYKAYCYNRQIWETCNYKNDKGEYKSYHGNG